MKPFHLKLIEEILLEKNFCLGLFTVNDFMHLSLTSKPSYKLIVKHKAIKRLVRFGNLDLSLRVRFWIKLSPFFTLQEALKDQVYKELGQSPPSKKDEPPSVYYKVVQSMTKDISEKVREEIARDLKRTHTSERMKT